MTNDQKNKACDVSNIASQVRNDIHSKSGLCHQMHEVDERSPWIVNGTKKVYDNPWISVRQDDVTQPDGNPGIYGVVHFKNKAIGVLPIDDEGYIYLVGQYRYPLESYSWEIPEGGCPIGQDPLDTARRELSEETGLSAKEWSLLGTAHLSNSATDEEAILYLATDLTQGQAEPEPTERLSHMRVPFAEALNMVLSGKITDAMSSLAIMFYAVKIGHKLAG